jgi:LmbE family N-acetylglucosaminyl deacetylase
MIVAHPDDETIFGFTKLIERNVKVLCMTGNDNEVRSSEFRKLMTHLSLAHEIYDFPDKWGGGFPYAAEAVIRDELESHNYKNVITHGSAGEYGHTQHQALFDIVSRNVGDKSLFTFGLSKKFLPADVLIDKLNTIVKYYPSQTSIGLLDWCQPENPDVNIMGFVIKESVQKHKT